MSESTSDIGSKGENSIDDLQNDSFVVKVCEHKIIYDKRRGKKERTGKKNAKEKALPNHLH